jgi:hypothetical protein
MKKELLESQLWKYTQSNQLTIEDKTMLQYLKKCLPQSEVDMSICSEDFFDYLLYDSDLVDRIKIELTQNYFDIIKGKELKIVDENTSISSVDKLMLFYKQNLEDLEYNLDFNLFGKMICIQAKFDLIPGKSHTPRHVIISYTLDFCGQYEIYISQSINHRTIVEARKKSKKINYYDLLAPFDLYPQTTDIEEFNNKIKKANLLKIQNGLQCKTDKTGIYIIGQRNSSTLGTLNLSKNGEKSGVIIETTLETESSKKQFEFKSDIEFTLPYVRVFSLLNKEYFFIHVDDLENYEYDKNAISKLIINERSKSVLTKVFQSNSSDYYGDFIKGKHGGLVVLAEGPPGVGKTSTAEVYAAEQEKPLYIVQINELGISSGRIESKLMIIFERVQKWGAVLLFDEIDVFLYKRQDNLDQSAIVGVFLRLLDYFSGLIFFTTNRSEVLDPAILSRISLKIKYESLDEKAQLQIWKSKLDDAGLTIDSLNLLPKMNLNGRQIKNAIRISKIIYGTELKEIEVKELLEDYM